MKTQQDHEFDAGLRERLDQLRDVPARNPESAALGRTAYLSQVRKLSAEVASDRKYAAQVVPVPAYRRFNGWLNSLLKPSLRPQRLSLAVALASLVLTLALLFGAAGVTVYAAQSSLPTDTLYPVKTLSEDVRLDLTNDPQARFELLLDFTDQRVNEIVALAAEGKTIPDEVVTRFETQYDSALLLLSSMDDSQRQEVLPKVKDAVAHAIQKLDRDQLQGGDNEDPSRINSSKAFLDNMRYRIGMLGKAVNDSELLQQLINEQFNTEAEPAASPDLDEEKAGPGECQNCTPVYGGSGPGFGPGPSNLGSTTQPVETPVPGEGGPGPSNRGATTQPQDLDGYGPGPGPGQMATPTEHPVNDSGEVGPSGPPAETLVPGEGGPGPSGGGSSPAPDSGGGDQKSSGGGGKP